jgi:hypothetical protein
MRLGIVCAAALAAVVPGQAGAKVFFGTYKPSDTAVTVKEHFLPLDYRAPDATQTFTTASSSGAFCANVFCNGFAFNSVTTEFTTNSSFSASHIIIPVRVVSSFGNFRIGYSISRWNAGTSSWDGLGGGQIESGLLPFGQTVEVELPFGESGARFIDFNYQPVAIEAGERYRVLARYGAGAAGGISWYDSDVQAATGQSFQYSAGHPASLANPSALVFQPAFALSDGKELVGGVPEPSTWAMMIGGFGMLGAAARRRTRSSVTYA